MSEKETPFARLVRARMAELGLGLRELCRGAGLDPSFFSKVLTGKRSPPAEESSLRALAAVLGLHAPRLIVAAGRIPEEWRRLREDGAFFEAVHAAACRGMASAPGPALAPRPTPAPKSAFTPPRRAPSASVQPLSDELL